MKPSITKRYAWSLDILDHVNPINGAGVRARVGQGVHSCPASMSLCTYVAGGPDRSLVSVGPFSGFLDVEPAAACLAAKFEEPHSRAENFSLPEQCCLQFWQLCHVM